MKPKFGKAERSVQVPPTDAEVVEKARVREKIIRSVSPHIESRDLQGITNELYPFAQEFRILNEEDIKSIAADIYARFQAAEVPPESL